MAKVLVACEFSGVVRDAFANAGHDAGSCDLLPSESPGNHILGDVAHILNDGWDLMIGHPPCTYICRSGYHWRYRIPGRDALTVQALDFVKLLMDAPIKHIAIENPIGRISVEMRKPEQIIQPYMFGHDAKKSTCLWLKNLPKLKPTQMIEGRTVISYSGKLAKRWGNQYDKYGHDNTPHNDDRWKIRSVTYTGIAQAMADQWGGLI